MRYNSVIQLYDSERLPCHLQFVKGFLQHQGFALIKDDLKFLCISHLGEI